MSHHTRKADTQRRQHRQDPGKKEVQKDPQPITPEFDQNQKKNQPKA